MPWSAQIHTKFHVCGATQDTNRSARVFRYGTVTLFGHAFQRVPLTFAFHILVLQPQQDKSRWFGLFRVRSPLLTESILFLFRGTSSLSVVILYLALCRGRHRFTPNFTCVVLLRIPIGQLEFLDRDWETKENRFR